MSESNGVTFSLHNASLRPPAMMMHELTGRYDIEWPNRGHGGSPVILIVMNSPRTTLRSTVTGLKYLSLLVSFPLACLPPKK